MILQLLRLGPRRCLSLGLVAGVTALGACSGGGSSGSQVGNDSGALGDAGGTSPDSSLPHDAAGGHDSTASSSSSGGAEASADVGGGGGGDGGGDAAFQFDGFSHADGYSEAAYCPDDDGDGWTACGGDCNDHDSLVNPCAFDTNDPTDPVGTDGIDNDCDGNVDNLVTCENGLVPGHDPTPADYAHAADLCDNSRCPRLVNAVWYGPTIASSKRITSHMGNSGQFNPHQGSFMAFLSSGTADDDVDTASYLTCPGTDFGVTYPNPMPLTAAQNVNPCGTGVDESSPAARPHDYTELRMAVKAPVNAGSFAFDFAFFSEEYPVYVCQGFNDTFLAIQTSKQFPTGQQIAFDANNHRINVNNAFFQDCNSCVNCVPGFTFTVTCNANSLSLLGGTSYEIPLGPTTAPPSQCNLQNGSGGTDWLKTTSPVQPGEQFTLSWIVFDEADGILDSSVILDHFRWHSTTLGNPVTGR
jgi:hypothetical protein